MTREDKTKEIVVLGFKIKVRMQYKGAGGQHSKMTSTTLHWAPCISF
jgi:hypothetical protein